MLFAFLKHYLDVFCEMRQNCLHKEFINIKRKINNTLLLTFSALRFLSNTKSMKLTCKEKRENFNSIIKIINLLA